ncbi:MAG: pimeloyl-ACP methyl ester carboxylesterase [Candidatus Aldehydirespiratoraceae bacterium]|jgi:pimeloyl-ACP methyl ester carboxylesterase
MTTSLVEGVTHRFIETNGIRMRIAEAGEGPLVVLAHGWPESWYSWRHQIIALAAAGFHVVAPEMRGYGATDAPDAEEAYNIIELAADLIGVIDEMGADRAHLVGHDWGSMVAANTALFHPDRLHSVTLMSVPFNGRPDTPPLTTLGALFGDAFFYINYHNEPGGVAEAEYDADPEKLLRRLYVSPDAPRSEPEVTDPLRAAGGWIPRLGEPDNAPAWLEPGDLDVVVHQFRSCGFRGGLNYYRNFDRNWELTEAYTGATIDVPMLFLAGADDAVIMGADADALRSGMAATDLRDVVLLPKIGHWVQQEAPAETSAALLEFFQRF